MAWLGLFTLMVFYWCLFTAVVTGRRSWAWLCLLCVPVLILAGAYEEGMEINGLLVVLCGFLFLVCRNSLKDILLWNQKGRKYHWVMLSILWLFCFLCLFYSVAQLQLLGYLWDFQGWRFERIPPFRMTITTLPMVGISYYYGEMCYNSIDRLWRKKSELVLIACHFFITNPRGGETGIDKGYFLDGIHNGIKYHFRMTKGTYFMLEKEKALRLQVQRGLLGGLYVVENPCPNNEKKAIPRDRKNAKIGMVCFVLTTILGIVYFFFSQYMTFLPWK